MWSSASRDNGLPSPVRDFIQIPYLFLHSDINISIHIVSHLQMCVCVLISRIGNIWRTISALVFYLWLPKVSSFHDTGLLRVETTRHLWFPLKTASNEEPGHPWISPTTRQQCRALVFSWLLAWTNSCTKRRVICDFRPQNFHATSLYL